MKRTSQELLEFFGLDKGTVYEEGIHRGIDEGYLFLKMNDIDFDVKLESVECSGSELGVDVRLSASMCGVMKLKPQLTDDEKVILRNLPEEYKWIVRDDCVNALYVHATFPRRYEDIYMSGVCQRMELFEHLFTFITWEDEPYLIEDLLK